jgi:hypothetical protein
VYQECSRAWTEISFANLDRILIQRLTAETTMSLLARVNAVEIAEVIDFRGTEFHCLSESRTTLDFLQTLIDSSNLWLIVVRRASFDNPRSSTSPVMQILRHFRHNKMIQVRDKGVNCSSCSQLVVDKSRQVVPGFFGVSLFSCSYCAAYFCRQGTCPMTLQRCMECDMATCRFCGDFV